MEEVLERPGLLQGKVDGSSSAERLGRRERRGGASRWREQCEPSLEVWSRECVQGGGVGHRAGEF